MTRKWVVEGEKVGNGRGTAVVYVIYENGQNFRATNKVKCPGIAN